MRSTYIMADFVWVWVADGLDGFFWANEIHIYDL